MRRMTWLAALALLAGCMAPPAELQADRGIGGTGSPPVLADRGIGGTGIDGVDVLGAITGFGSILIDGVEIAIPPGISVTQLRVGQVVAISARRDGARLLAERIEPRPVVVGPVETRAADGQLRIAGQAVLSSSAAPRIGQWVAVSGFRRADGVIAATRIDPAPSGVARITGLVRQGPNGPVIGGTRLRGAVAAGNVLAVEGRYTDGILSVTDAHAEGLTPFGRGDRRSLIQAFVGDSNGGLQLGEGGMVRRVPGLAPPATPIIAVVELRPDGTGGAIAVSLDHAGVRDDSAARAAPTVVAPTSGLTGPAGTAAPAIAAGIAPSGTPAGGHGGGSPGGTGIGGSGPPGVGGAGAGLGGQVGAGAGNGAATGPGRGG